MHVLREANQVAHGLANKAYDIRVLDFPRSFISNVLRADVVGTCFVRGF